MRISLMASVALLTSLTVAHVRADEPRESRDGEAHREVLTFPGPHTDRVVAVLERIAVGRIAAERARGDFFLRGRFSDVNMSWQEGMRSQEPGDLPSPDWFPFLLIHKGRKRRYDQAYAQRGADWEYLATSYRLMDGEAFVRREVAGLSVLTASGRAGPTVPPVVP